MKKYIGLVLLLCVCLLGGCGQEKQGPLAFLEEFTQEELDAYLLGRTREDLWEEFGESKFDSDSNENIEEYWEVDEFYGKNLRVEYDENFVVISCEVYTYKSGADFLPFYFLGAILMFASVIWFIGVVIPFVCVIPRKFHTKARVFGVLGIISLLCRTALDTDLVATKPLTLLPLIVFFFSWLLIPYTIVGVIFTIIDLIKNGIRGFNKINCGVTLFLVGYIVMRAISSPDFIFWVLKG